MSCCKSSCGCGCPSPVQFPISYAPPAYPMGYGGYGDHRGCGFSGNNWGFGGIWIIIIILLLCGGCGFNDRDRDCGCDDGFDNGCGFGGSWIIIIILLLCFCGGSGFGW